MTNESEIDVTDLKYEDTTFFGLFKVLGLKNFKNWSVYWAFVLTVAMFIITVTHESVQAIFNNLSGSLIVNLIGASAGIFGIVIAALTLTLTLFNQSLLPAMLKKKLLQRYLFPFWFTVALWAINIVVCIFILLIKELNMTNLVVVGYTFEMFLFLYATFYTVGLTGLLIRLALQKAQIE